MKKDTPTDNSKHNGNINKVGKYHPGWQVMERIPVIPGGRSAQELARLTGLTQQAISSVEHQALRKLAIRLQHSKEDLKMFNPPKIKQGTRKSSARNF